MDDDAFHGPEERTRCLVKFQVSHPQVVMGPEREEGQRWAGCWFLGGW